MKTINIIKQAKENFAKSKGVKPPIKRTRDISVAIKELLQIYEPKASFRIKKTIYEDDIARTLNYDNKDEGREFFLFLYQVEEERLYDMDTGITKYTNEYDEEIFIFESMFSKYDDFFDLRIEDRDHIGKIVWGEICYSKEILELSSLVYNDEDMMDYFVDECGYKRGNVANMLPHENILYLSFLDVWPDIFRDYVKKGLFDIYYEINMSLAKDTMLWNNSDIPVSFNIKSYVDNSYNNYTYDIALYDKKIGSILDRFVVDKEKYIEFVTESEIETINIVVDGTLDTLDYIKLVAGYNLDKFNINNPNIYIINSKGEQLTLTTKQSGPFLLDTETLMYSWRL